MSDNNETVPFSPSIFIPDCEITPLTDFALTLPPVVDTFCNVLQEFLFVQDRKTNPFYPADRYNGIVTLIRIIFKPYDAFSNLVSAVDYSHRITDINFSSA